MTQVAIVYHSGYGHTRRMAPAVADGAAESAQVQQIEIDAEGNVPESSWATLLAADAIVFGSPTYMRTVSWQFKKFADATSKPWFTQQWKDKLAAGFTNSASISICCTCALSQGRVVEVTFLDGEVVVGTTMGYDPRRPGYFIFPVDPKANNTKIFVVSAAVRSSRYR